MSLVHTIPVENRDKGVSEAEGVEKGEKGETGDGESGEGHNSDLLAGLIVKMNDIIEKAAGAAATTVKK